MPTNGLLFVQALATREEKARQQHRQWQEDHDRNTRALLDQEEQVKARELAVERLFARATTLSKAAQDKSERASVVLGREAAVEQWETTMEKSREKWEKEQEKRELHLVREQTRLVEMQQHIEEELKHKNKRDAARESTLITEEKVLAQKIQDTHRALEEKMAEATTTLSDGTLMVFLDGVGCCWVLSGGVGCCWVLSGVVGCCRVLLGVVGWC
jgi:HrpA-like RNA helicase